jgi:UbiD family decarboxylase
MKFRDFLTHLEKNGKLVHVKKAVEADLELGAVLAAMEGKAVVFDSVNGYGMPVVGNLCSSRKLIAEGLGTTEKKLVKRLAIAAANPVAPEVVSSGACQEVVEHEVDLNKIPAMKYTESDGGKYIPSAVCIVKDPELGRNVCFHRLMLIDKNHFAIRLVEGRGTHAALQKAGELEIAITVGNSMPVLLAAATSLKPGMDEFGMANALEKTDLVKCKTVNIEVPADCEYVLEGRITKQTTSEGPFVDLTGIADKVRQQPVVEIKKITHRANPIFQALLPGKQEHRLLMGMPREPTIFNEVSKVCKCTDVYISEGGCSWLHGIVKIKKQNADDGKKALEAAFRGHHSMKHCIVVDDDIDIRDPEAVEWAIATRVQADKSASIMSNQPGSSLDPSSDLSEGKKATTCKVGIDATIPWDKKDKGFIPAKFRKIKKSDYL